MLKLIFLLLLYRHAECILEDMFAFNVDDIISTMIGPVYKVRRTSHTTPIFILEDGNSTTTNLPGITPYAFFPNKTEVQDLKKQIDLELIMNDTTSGKPNFDADELKILSRRFDSVLKDKVNPGKPILREFYFARHPDDIALIKHQKKLILQLMEHFLYETRYKMPYPQKMRREYYPRIRYKIGYCFSLLRILKRKQYVLYSIFQYNFYENRVYKKIYEYIKFFEKILRIDLEISDLLRYIRDLEAERVAEFGAMKKQVTSNETAALLSNITSG